jgi:DNA-binding transcriptional MerR regulator
MARGMTIGGLAKLAGVNVETIRYYQRLGIVAQPRRPLGGQRTYSEETVAELAFVRRAQDFGFTLGEIAELLRLGRSNGRTAVRRIAETRYAKLSLHVEQLKKLRGRLKRLLAEAQRRGDRGADPIIAVLRGEEPMP